MAFRQHNIHTYVHVRAQTLTQLCIHTHTLTHTYTYAHKHNYATHILIPIRAWGWAHRRVLNYCSILVQHEIILYTSKGRIKACFLCMFLIFCTFGTVNKCTHTSMHTYSHSHAHTYTKKLYVTLRMHKHTYIYTRAHTHTHTHTHTCTHTYAHLHTHLRPLMRMHTHLRALMCMHTRACIRTQHQFHVISCYSHYLVYSANNDFIFRVKCRIRYAG